MPDQTVGDVLESALSEIRTEGWCRNKLRDRNTGSMCAVGAVNKVVVGDAYFWYGDLNDEDPRVKTHQQVLEVLANHIPSDFKTSDVSVLLESAHRPTSVWQKVVDYNNARGRTKAEIEEWFTKAALDAGISV